MNKPIKFTTVTISDDFTLGIEARFEDGQKYQIASMPEELSYFAHWLSEEINAGRVPCFTKASDNRIKGDPKLEKSDD